MYTMKKHPPLRKQPHQLGRKLGKCFKLKIKKNHRRIAICMLVKENLGIDLGRSLRKEGIWDWVEV